MSKRKTACNTSGPKTKAVKQKTSVIPEITFQTLAGKDAVDKSSLQGNFFDQDCVDLAKALLGKVIVSRLHGLKLCGVIVETEAYIGPVDKAAHSYNNKRTERTEAMYMAPGTAYVYNIYGLYCCLNVSSRGEGSAVLIRGVEPLDEGTLPTMKELRTGSLSEKGKKSFKNTDIGSGPSKLTQALAINKDNSNKVDLCANDFLWLEDRGAELQDKDIVVCKRINIKYAEEWVDKPLRFYVLGNKHVSVRDKNAEQQTLED